MKFKVKPYLPQGTIFHFMEYIKQFSDVTITQDTVEVGKDNIAFLKYVAEKYDCTLMPV